MALFVRKTDKSPNVDNEGQSKIFRLRKSIEHKIKKHSNQT
jgi:hypothetical protein